jgi:hypothetical protein
MNSILIAGIVFACAFGGVVLGMFLQRVIPESHLLEESKDGIKLGTGLIATMAALVLGLLIGGAKSSFESQRTGFQQLATNVILLDRTLAHYGPDTEQARVELRNTVTAMIDHFFSADSSQRSGLEDAAITTQFGALFNAIRGLKSADDSHRGDQMHALQITSDLARARWQLTQRDEDSLPLAFLVVLEFWLFVLFASFGAFWARNVTVVVVFFICAISVATALFLIVDLDQPFEGLIQVSSGSLRDALSQLGK